MIENMTEDIHHDSVSAQPPASSEHSDSPAHEEVDLSTVEEPTANASKAIPREGIFECEAVDHTSAEQGEMVREFIKSIGVSHC